MMQIVSRSRTLDYALAALLAIAISGTAWAGGGHSWGEHNGPCAADIKALCPDANSREEVHSCLRDHADQLSPDCSAKIAARRQAFEAARTACASDVASLCPDAQGPDIRQCLHEHKGDLSDGCSQALHALHHHHCGEATPSS